MNRIIIALLTCITSFLTLHAQDEWDLGVNYVIWAADEEGKVFKNQAASVVVGYKDADGNVIYLEGHTGVTNELGNLSIKVGHGVPIEGELTIESFKEITTLCYEIHMDVDGELLTVTGEKMVCAVPRANAAACALQANNSNHLGGILWGLGIVNIGQILCPPVAGYSYNIPYVFDSGERGFQREFGYTAVTDLVRMRSAPKANPDGDEISYLNIGLGLGKPMYCGPDPEYIRAMHAIRMPTINNLTYGAEITIDNYDADHSTWAILGQNVNSMGGGILAYGPNNIGSLNVGRGGAQAQGVGTGSVYGFYGLIPNAGVTGDSRVGGLFYDGGHTMNYALRTIGAVNHSVQPTVGSDVRWKREIRTESGNILASINKLRPAIYHYNEDTPFSLPKDLQHGFIAQELETVFPELVSDVVHPKSYDPDLILNSETETYKAIQYSGLISILTAGIQELDATVQTQQEEINTLKEMVKELSRQLADLKN